MHLDVNIVYNTSMHKRIICFLAILIILLELASLAVRPYGGEVYDIKSTDRKIRDIRTEADNTIDVLFAGNSLVFQDISPLQVWNRTGITSYDLSDGAMRLCDQYTLIKNACTRQRIKLIVLEPGMFFSDASPYKDDFALPTNLIEKIFPIFHYHTFYKAWSFSDDDESVRITRLMKGFQTTEDTTPYTGGSDYMEENEKPEEIQDLNRRYLNDIVSFCNENGIKIIVAALPSPVNYNMGKHKAVSEWADEYGIEFIDLNLMQEELGIDWNTDTKDGGDHLNIEGSKKVTGFLAEYISDGYGLADHRGEAGYEKWEQDYKEAALY